jgi:NOL1/NOP2/fmu family ribosome biogenesis protein
MDKLSALNSKEKKHLFNLIKEQFGSEINFDIVFVNTQNKIFVLSDFKGISLEGLRVNSLGLYLGELRNNEFRLSIEGAQLIGMTATKNILVLSDGQAKRWMAGEDFEVDSSLKGFVLVKHEKEFLGCGKIINGKLLNYVPKERRVNV